jgi:hypothetical protein
MDNTSPQHVPFQEYKGISLKTDPISGVLLAKWIIDMIKHSRGEAQINPEQMRVATMMVQENYRLVYGDRKAARAFTTRDPMAFLSALWPAYTFPASANVVAEVTIYPDGTVKAKGRTLISHPGRVK